MRALENRQNFTISQRLPVGVGAGYMSVQEAEQTLGFVEDQGYVARQKPLCALRDQRGERMVANEQVQDRQPILTK